MMESFPKRLLVLPLAIGGLAIPAGCGISPAANEARQEFNMTDAQADSPDQVVVPLSALSTTTTVVIETSVPEVQSLEAAEATDQAVRITIEPMQNEKDVMIEAVYCGIPIKYLVTNPQEARDIIKAANITEVHPPCTSPFGRQGIAEGATEAMPGISLVKANQMMLEFGKENGFQYYVDEPRFLSGDLVAIRAAYEDYKEWINIGRPIFGMEVHDEMQPDQLNAVRPSLETLRDFFLSQGLDIAGMIRPNLAGALPETMPELVRTWHDIIGPRLRLGVDVSRGGDYTADPESWAPIFAALNQPGYEVKDTLVAAKNSKWANKVTGIMNADPSVEVAASYMRLAESHASDGITGYYVFTGFLAVDNSNETFVGNLSEPENLATLLGARATMGLNAQNQIPLK